MTLVRHELRQGRVAFFIWTISIGFLLAICVLIFPEMKGDMDSVTEMFSSMGSFSAAFGMDVVNFGSLTGFYAVECGNILGLGGAFFAALCAVPALAKEEKEHTAGFLLTHPVSRRYVVSNKLLSVLLQIVFMNIIIFGVSVGSMFAIGEEIPWEEIILLHFAYFLMQIEIAGICFGISAFLRKNSLGIGLGIATMMYFLNIIANITESAEFLKYITPFGYAEGSDIVTELTLDSKLVLIGMVYAVLGIIAAYIRYYKKDIA